MRHLALVLTLAACHHATPAPPIVPTNQPLPAYGGAVWSGPCTVTLGPASASERDARLAAMQTWIPGARIELTELGDRARRIWIPGAPPKNRRPAVRRMRNVLESTAPLFGVPASRRDLRAFVTPDGWLAEISLGLTDPTSDGGRYAHVLVMIDRRTGEARVGLVDDIHPDTPPCERAVPFDEMTYVNAVVGRPMPGADNDPPSAITRFDVVVERAIVVERHGLTARGVMYIGVGPSLATAPDGETRAARLTAFLVIDPVTLEVIDTRTSRGLYDVVVPARDPIADAARLFPK